MTIIKSSDFNTRIELDNHVKSLKGESTEPSSEYQIEGTKADLARLFLSATTVVWGVSCVVTDETEDQAIVTPVERG